MTDACDARSEAPRTDLSGEVRPMTLMKAKLHMQKVAAGDAIEIVVSGDEEMRDLAQSMKDEGHRTEQMRREADLYCVLVRKGG